MCIRDRIVFYVEALRENELEKFKVKFNEQQYNLQMEYYQQLKERQEEDVYKRQPVRLVPLSPNISAPQQPQCSLVVSR